MISRVRAAALVFPIMLGFMTGCDHSNDAKPRSANSTITVSSGSLLVTTSDSWTQVSASHYTAPLPQQGNVKARIQSDTITVATVPFPLASWSITITPQGTEIAKISTGNNVVDAVAENGGTWSLQAKTLTYCDSSNSCNVSVANVKALATLAGGDSTTILACASGGECPANTHIVCVGPGC